LATDLCFCLGHGHKQSKELEITSDIAIWYRPGNKPSTIRWVLVRDSEGRRDPQAFFSTDVTLQPAEIIAFFVRRWQVEVTFAETRTHLGVETQRQWSDKAPAKVVAATWVGSDALTVIFRTGGGGIAERILFRDDEPRLALPETGRSWSFEADEDLLRLVTEATRIQLAHHFDLYLAIHTSQVIPLPHFTVLSIKDLSSLRTMPVAYHHQQTKIFPRAPLNGTQTHVFFVPDLTSPCI